MEGMTKSARTRGLGIGRRARLAVRCGLELLRDLAGYSFRHREWWVVPLVAVLVLASLLAALGQAAVPYTIYTIF